MLRNLKIQLLLFHSQSVESVDGIKRISVKGQIAEYGILWEINRWQFLEKKLKLLIYYTNIYSFWKTQQDVVVEVDK